VAANYFSQLCMLKHNMILGDSITDNYLNNQLWYTHLLYQIWCMFMYSSMKVDILTVLFCEETQNTFFIYNIIIIILLFCNLAICRVVQ
jgi:uncharacterized membrane protein